MHTVDAQTYVCVNLIQFWFMCFFIYVLYLFI